VNLVPTRWYTSLFMPTTVSIVLIAIGLWMVWRAMRNPSRGRMAGRGLGMATVGMMLLYACCTPLVATWIARSLETQSVPISVADAPHVDAIVVLGGGIATMMRPDGTADLYWHNASDRFERGVAAFKAGKAPCLAIGGGDAVIDDAPTVSDWVRQQAIERGVPASALIVGGAASYTTDESEGLVKELRTRGVRTILLCTSAYHIPRARLIYERLGMQAVAMPCDFDTRGAAERFSMKLLIPRGLALAQTEACLKEWIGLAALRLGALR
jgi:uncharacterized SAM-binding protein YcdF (DUF218 family)